jgi:hypothetical protein
MLLKRLDRDLKNTVKFLGFHALLCVHEVENINNK